LLCFFREVAGNATFRIEEDHARHSVEALLDTLPAISIKRPLAALLADLESGGRLADLAYSGVGVHVLAADDHPEVEHVR
jgi:hypothetical protein